MAMGADDWDLQAVVRGCCFRNPEATTAVEDPFSSFPPTFINPFSSLPPTFMNEELMVGEEGALTRFPDLMSAQTAMHELEELLKPFFPELYQRPVLSPQKISPSSPRMIAASPIPAASQPQQPRQPHSPLPQTPRSKRRKNQQQKVVCQVPADGQHTDRWAWRKYGQKPIKGSPYPRGYYRCSSSKGCLARKQVERSRTDPSMLVITYTAEHNHPVPTHRNSLAGSTRNKLVPPYNAMPSQTQLASPYGAICGGVGETMLQPSNPSSSPLSSSTATCLSPRTPLTASMEDELLHRHLLHECAKADGEEKGGDDEAEEEEDVLVGDEMMFEDDFLFHELGRHVHLMDQPCTGAR